MQNKIENKQRMLAAVWAVLTQYNSIWQNNLGLKELVDELKSFIDELTVIRPKAEAVSSGVTTSKSILKEDVIDSVKEVAGPLATAFARNKDMESNAKVVFSNTELDRMLEPDLADVAIEIAQIATENLEIAKKYGLTAEDVKQLEDISKSYKAILPKGRALVSVRVASKKSRKKTLRSATILLKENIDGVIENYRRKSPEFWDAYFSARKTVEYGVRHEKTAKGTKTAKDITSEETETSKEAVADGAKAVVNGTTTVADSATKEQK